MPKLNSAVQPPLIQAILKKDVERVRQLLTEGADPNVTDTDGRPALTVAEYKQEIQVALIDAGADLSKADRGKLNPVWAVGTGRMDVLRKVIEAGGDINCHTLSGTPVHVAARSGRAEMVRLLIELGADINAGTSISNPLAAAIEHGHAECALLLLRAGDKPESGVTYDPRTLLTMAAHRGQAEVVEALLSAGAAVDARGKVTEFDRETYQSRELYANGTALHIAATRGDLRTVDALLTAGANPTLRDENGNQPLDLARREGHAAVVKRLEQALTGFPDATDPNEELLLAAERGDTARIRDLLATGGCDPNVRDGRARSKNATPLLLATRKGHHDAALLLLEAGADANLHDAVDPKLGESAKRWARDCDSDTIVQMGLPLGRTALGEAAARGDAEMVSLLLRQGATVDAADVLDQTSLFIAAEQGYTAVVRALFTAGANPNAKDCRKTPVLKAAVNGKNAKVVVAVLAAGGTASGRAAGDALYEAAESGSVETVRALLSAGFKPDATGWGNRTAMFAAADRAHLEVLRALIDAGANVNHAAKGGETPLHDACRAKAKVTTWKDGQVSEDAGAAPGASAEAARVLLDAGAAPNAIDSSGWTPLAWALMAHNYPLVALLLERGANPNLGRIQEKTPLELARVNKVPGELLELVERAAASMTAQAAGHGTGSTKETKPKKKRVKPRELPEEPAVPDFSAALNREDYREAVANLERRCGSKAVAFEHAPGAFHLHVDSRANFNFDEARKELTARGCTLVWLDVQQKQQVGLFPTGNVFEVLLALGTNGANYDLAPADVVNWLRKLHAEQPFEITTVSFDAVKGFFHDDVKNPKQLARRMYKFCPDLVDQGVGSVAALAKSLQDDRLLYFWWD